MEDQIYCRRCECELNEDTNWIEHYICPFEDEPLCDKCFNYLESHID